jgi:hypothetical protein
MAEKSVKIDFDRKRLVQNTYQKTSTYTKFSEDVYFLGDDADLSSIITALDVVSESDLQEMATTITNDFEPIDRPKWYAKLRGT